MECIILAGGLGTRLRGVIGEQPKCLAAVNGSPFLHYLFYWLEQQGCTSVILSLGYQHQAVLDWIASSQQWPFRIQHVVETEPLGTGGGLKLALQKATEQHIAVLNGDTMLQLKLADLISYHIHSKAATTIALKEMQDFDRYGVVKIDEDNTITAFEEKAPRKQGLINGGVYIIDKQAFAARNLPDKFSFEKDYLEPYLQAASFKGFITTGNFIDIGIPVDYSRVQNEFMNFEENFLFS